MSWPLILQHIEYTTQNCLGNHTFKDKNIPQFKVSVTEWLTFTGLPAPVVVGLSPAHDNLWEGVRDCCHMTSHVGRDIKT